MYLVERIDEDIDFGCEERDEDSPVMALVTLVDGENQKVIRYPDDELYALDIREGDQVIFLPDGRLKKPLTGDWTKKCQDSSASVEAFTRMLMAARFGKEISWVCPFCGGRVERISHMDGHTVIGCVNCDMRITLDQT